MLCLDIVKQFQTVPDRHRDILNGIFRAHQSLLIVESKEIKIYCKNK